MASEALPTPAPRHLPNWAAWVRDNLFNTWYNAVITVVLGAVIVWLFTTLFSFIVGGTWAAVVTRLKLFFVGPYPTAEMWRIQAGVMIFAALLGLSAGIWKGPFSMINTGLAALTGVMLALTPLVPDQGLEFPLNSYLFLVVMLVGSVGGYYVGRAGGNRLKRPLVVAWLLSIPLVYRVLFAGIGGSDVLPEVSTNLWGGLLVTMILTVVGISASFPLGVALALGRRSDLPVVRAASTIYIEVVRGVPLITFFFMGQLLLPLFLPGEIRVDALVRAMVAVTLFAAAYLAENVRGGLQSLPNGQYEAAHALGLNYIQTTFLIILPQALRAVIPAIVGLFIGMFKDTTLVSIVGILDLLAIGTAVRTQPDWIGIPGGVWKEVFFFLSIIYFIVSFAMSRVSLRIERDLGVGQR